MSKVFVVVFLIFGTVVGSGFSSGKEIMVFFSRFGVLSYLYIILAGFLFFLLFYFFLSHGKKIAKFLEKSKLLNIVIAFISLIFCASMFAGIKSLFEYFPTWLYVLSVVLLVLGCVVITLKGIKGFERLNLILMPATSIVFLVVLVYALPISSNFSISTNSWAGFLYSPLYVALNTSMSGLVIAKVGEGLSKKQTFFASLFSVLLLLVFLLLGNFVLQRNSESFISEMPFLYLMRDNSFMFVLAYIVVLVGCFTTLISQCLTLKSFFENFVKNQFCVSLVSVLIPFFISVLGFSQIISFLYPICSVLGIFVLICVIFSEISKGSGNELTRGKYHFW